MATYRYVVADVFTDRPLAGNQLAVFTDAREIPEEQLQPLAREINFSETIYVYKPEGEGHARCGSSRRPPSSTSRGTRCWGRRSCSAARSS